MKTPLLIFPVDHEGIPFESRSELNTRNSLKLERYLLELDTYPGKDPSSIIISEKREHVEGPAWQGTTPGLTVITADGRITFHSYSGGAGQGKGKCPVLEPVKLRQGWAVFKTGSGEKDDVRIYGTKEEAIGACVLFGAIPLK